MRRGLERYAPTTGYDPGALTRSKILDVVVRKAGILPGDWVLDVQTGEGLLGVNVGRAFTRAKVIATDPDRSRLLKARENATAEGCEGRMRFIQCLPDALPIKDEKSFFTTIGMDLAMEDEPLDALEEIHRVTAFYAKVYAVAADMERARKVPKGMAFFVFNEETLSMMKETGYGKVQIMQIAHAPDGARILLVTTKRFDPEDGEDVPEEDDAENE